MIVLRLIGWLLIGFLMVALMCVLAIYVVGEGIVWLLEQLLTRLKRLEDQHA